MVSRREAVKSQRHSTVSVSRLSTPSKCSVTPRHVQHRTSHRILSHHITSKHNTSHHITLCHVEPWLWFYSGPFRGISRNSRGTISSWNNYTLFDIPQSVKHRRFRSKSSTVKSPGFVTLLQWFCALGGGGTKQIPYQGIRGTTISIQPQSVARWLSSI